MEPVVLPKVIAPATRTDRVRRAQPREDSGHGSAFARYLRKEKENPPEAPAPPPEDAGEASGPEPTAPMTEASGQPGSKRVDIRV
jgi:hypothetical protein